MELFVLEDLEKPAVEAVRVDWWNMTAHRMNALPEGWRWFAIDAHDKPEDFVELQGAVPIGVAKSGKRKGEPIWPPRKECQKLWIRIGDRDETMRLWEVETGKCSPCSGIGTEWAGWSATEGSRFRECRKCSGTGKA